MKIPIFDDILAAIDRFLLKIFGSAAGTTPAAGSSTPAGTGGGTAAGTSAGDLAGGGKVIQAPIGKIVKMPTNPPRIKMGGGIDDPLIGFFGAQGSGDFTNLENALEKQANAE